MILHNKNAIVYGAGGSLGGAVAKGLARAGARLFLAGRRRHPVQRVADEILASGGQAEADDVDALDETAVNRHLEKVAQRAGTVDISFNAVGVEVIQNILLVDMAADDFMSPITVNMRTRFLTAKAAGKLMMKQRSGIILSLTATPGGIGYPFTGGFGPACSAVESFSTNLASELGLHGVRVVNIRSAGSPDSNFFKEAIARDPEGMKPILRRMEDDTMLKELPSMADNRECGGLSLIRSGRKDYRRDDRCYVRNNYRPESSSVTRAARINVAKQKKAGGCPPAQSAI
jgi:NAD(P)-dependent dehydrogenase (short-subunit alcohol dehydrogenase family)